MCRTFQTITILAILIFFSYPVFAYDQQDFELRKANGQVLELQPKWGVRVGTTDAIKSALVGGRYYFNRYLDFDAQLVASEGYGSKDLYSKVSVGVGITPLRMEIFGRESLNLGVVLGYSLSGNSRIGMSQNLNAFVRPRIGINISQNLLFELSATVDEVDGFDYFDSAIALNYRF